MKLLVVRHAIAMDREDFQRTARASARTKGADEDIEANDEFRPLTDDGVRKMKKNAKGLARLVERVDLLVTSPLIRAVQTAEILDEHGWKGVSRAVTPSLKPGMEPAEFLAWLKSREEAKSKATIAIVGHEPHLSSLVSWLLTSSSRSIFELKKGGACLLEFKAGIEKGRANLLWLSTPAQLRKI